MAGALRKHGATEDELHAALTVINQRCVPPLEEADLRRIARSVSRYTPAQVNEQTMARATPSHPPTMRPNSRPEARTVKMHEVERRAIQWIFRGYILLGKLTVVDGDPGLGKSTMLLDIAARVSTNGYMPDGECGVRGNVAILSAEDGVEDTIQPRLEAAGADMSRIEVITEVPGVGGWRPPTIPEDLEAIEAVVRRMEAKLLIVDPLMAFLGAVDAIKDQDVRKALHAGGRMAERTGCGVVMLRHLNKGGGGKAIYRGGGSIGIIGAARSGLLVAKNPDDESEQILACIKTNLGRMPPSLRFRLQEAENEVCRVAWCGVSSHKANDLVGAPETAEEREESDERRSKLELAQEVLRRILAPGPKPCQACRQELVKVGVAQRTTNRAAKALNVRLLFPNENETGDYAWSLPATGLENGRSYTGNGSENE
jgi:hypothetical protein